MNKHLILTATISNVTIGLVIGVVFGLVNYKLIELTLHDLVKYKEVSLFTYLIVALRIVLLAIPFLLGCLFPTTINIFGAFIGELMPKLFIIITNLKNKDREV